MLEGPSQKMRITVTFVLPFKYPSLQHEREANKKGEH